MKIEHWSPGKVGSNEAQLRARFPDEFLRVSTTLHEPGIDIGAFSIDGFFFVEAGRASFRSSAGDLELTAGTFVHFPGGEFHVTALDDQPCTIIKVWVLTKLVPNAPRGADS